MDTSTILWQYIDNLCQIRVSKFKIGKVITIANIFLWMFFPSKNHCGAEVTSDFQFDLKFFNCIIWTQYSWFYFLWLCKSNIFTHTVNGHRTATPKSWNHSIKTSIITSHKISGVVWLLHTRRASYTDARIHIIIIMKGGWDYQRYAIRVHRENILCQNHNDFRGRPQRHCDLG